MEIEKRNTRDGFETLRKLSDDWKPWKYQIERFVNDAKDYGSAGKTICVSAANYGTLSSAKAAWSQKLASA